MNPNSTELFSVNCFLPVESGVISLSFTDKNREFDLNGDVLVMMTNFGIMNSPPIFREMKKLFQIFWME